MSEATPLGLKQLLVLLTEAEQQDVSAFLSCLGQENDDEWKEEAARRLDLMSAAEQTSVAGQRTAS